MHVLIMHLCSCRTHALCNFPALVITSQANTFDQSTCIKYHIRLAQHNQQNSNSYVTIHHRSHRSKSCISCIQNWNETLILILESFLSFYLCLFSVHSESVATVGHFPVRSFQPCVPTHSVHHTHTVIHAIYHHEIHACTPIRYVPFVHSATCTCVSNKKCP